MAHRLRVVAVFLLLIVTAFAGCTENSGDENDDGSGEPGDTGDGDPGMVAASFAPCTVADGSDWTVDAGTIGALPAGEYRATVKTSKGDFTIDLYDQRAPLSTANFLQYAQDGFYQNTVFHRVMKDFVIQGGGFSAPFEGQDSKKETDGPIPTEIWEGNHHGEGTLGMARTQDPNSATSQWFVNTNENTNLDSGYTVFAEVVDGMDVVNEIEQVSTTSKAGFQNVPAEDVVINGVDVQTPDVPTTPSLAAYQEAYAVAPNGTVSLPVFVKNVGGERGIVDVVPSVDADAGLQCRLLHEPGALSAGQAGIAILEVKAPEDFEGARLQLTGSADDASDAVTLDLTVANTTGEAASEAYPKVEVRYIGLYDNGVTFDTTRGDLGERGFPMPAGFQTHTDPLKVWVGEGQSSDGAYTPVIGGFKDAVLGLEPGETRTVRLTPEEGYQDGLFRTFQIEVVAVHE